MNATRALTRSRYALSVLLGLLAPLHARAGEPPDEAAASTGLERAMVHFERCHWVQAFEELALLADAGHPDAARIALMMRTHGTRLFGHHFVAGAAQRDRWLDAATGDVRRGAARAGGATAAK